MSDSEFVSIKHICTMLGRTEGHVQHIVRSAKYDFPPSRATGLKGCALYRRAEVEAWKQRTLVSKTIDNTMAQMFIRGKIGRVTNQGGSSHAD
jgi:predicted DNA-binding transcriptional regulator AlpA